jgi:predicted amidohydrolase
VSDAKRAALCAGVVQLCSRQNVEENLTRAAGLVTEAHARGAELVVLPENFGYIGKLEVKLSLAETLEAGEQTGPILSRMQQLARELGIHLLLGGTPVRSPDPARFHNTSVLFDPSGRVLAAYRKIHLFDVRVPAGPRFAESELVLPGEELVTAPLPGGVVLGLSVCYDLRFPELYRGLVTRGANLLSVPAAFTLHTGKDHWLPLLRARAIENLCYVCAAGQHGAHTESRRSYGKSCIIDPWGAVIAAVSDADGVAVAPIDLAYLEQVRRELPALAHRRLP